jgi:hypothetical protein
MNARVPYAANQRPPSLAPPLLMFHREGGEGKRRTYLFVAGEGHDEDLGIWRRHR